MPDLSVKSIQKDARLFLAAGPTNYIKLTLVYVAVLLGAQLLSGLVTFVTGLLMKNAGGLSGLGARTVLNSVDAVVALAVNLLTPFWTIGFAHCAIGLARQDPMEPQHLTEGFYRFFVILRLALAQGIVYMVVISLATNLSSILFMMLPASEKALAVAEPYITDPAAVAAMTQTEALTFLSAMWPLLVITALIGALFLIPLFYSYRMCIYRVMDNERPGALLTTMQSRRMMKGNRLSLFKLDLSFWWYYGLMLLIYAAAYLPIFLLPDLDHNTLTLCCIAIQCVGLFFLQWKCLPYVETGYAVFYDRLLQYHKSISPHAPQPDSEQWTMDN